MIKLIAIVPLGLIIIVNFAAIFVAGQLREFKKKIKVLNYFGLQN